MNNRKKGIYILGSSIILLLILCFGVVFWLCKDNSIYLYRDKNVFTDFHTKLNGHTKSIPGLPVENTIESGIVNDEAICEQNYSVNIKSGEPYNRFIYLKQNVEKEGDYSLVVFDNFKQIPFKVDGTEMNYCTIHLTYDDELYVPVTIDDLNNGCHRLVFIWLFNVNKKLPEKKVSELDYLVLSSALWTDVIVGENENNVPYPTYQGDFFEECNNTISIQATDQEDSVWHGIIQPNFNDNRIYLTAGNNNSENTARTVLWGLCDYEQITMNPNGDYCIYAEIPEGKFISQPISYETSTPTSHTYQTFSMNLDTGEIAYSDSVYLNAE